MKHNLKTYFILLVVFVLSIFFSWLVPANIILKSIVASPGLIALFSALLQIIRDQSAYERTLLIQQQQHQFVLGTASHMADTAFDMHVEFCENYMDEVHKILHLLFREGDTREVLNNAYNLHTLRENYAVWLTDQIDKTLGIFEHALRTLGASSQFINSTTGDSQYKNQRSIKINDNFELLSSILGFDKSSDIKEDYAIESIKIKLRNILGVEELTNLRINSLKDATEALSKVG